MKKAQRFLLAMLVAASAALVSLPAEAFFGMFASMFGGWGWGGYPYYGGWGYPYYGWGYPHYGYGWGYPYRTYPYATVPVVTVQPATRAEK